ncbi:MAG: hypothetical protein U0264_11615 [Candidatus Kapaibacterium sp.]
MIRYRFLSLFILLCLCALHQSADAHSELTVVGVNGGFSQRVRYMYNYTNGIVDSSSKRKTEMIHFDKKGRVATILRYDSTGAVESIEVHTYTGKLPDDHYTHPYFNTRPREVTIYSTIRGKFSETMFIRYNSIGEVIDRFRIRGFLNNKGQILKQLESHAITATNDSFYLRSTSAYNAQGELIESINYSPDSSVSTKELLHYTNGLLTETINFTSGKYDGKHTYFYNKRRRLVYEVAYNFQDSVVEKVTYIHKKNEKITETVYFKRDNSTQTTPVVSYHRNVSYYDHKGHIIEWTDSDSSGTITKRNLWKYDRHGNKTAFTCACYPANAFCCLHSPNEEWRYDTYSNCVEEITYDATNKPKYKSEFVYSR